VTRIRNFIPTILSSYPPLLFCLSLNPSVLPTFYSPSFSIINGIFHMYEILIDCQSIVLSSSNLYLLPYFLNSILSSLFLSCFYPPMTTFISTIRFSTTQHNHVYNTTKNSIQDTYVVCVFVCVCFEPLSLH
jgi:hypothetical protein